MGCGGGGGKEMLDQDRAGERRRKSDRNSSQMYLKQKRECVDTYNGKDQGMLRARLDPCTQFSQEPGFLQLRFAFLSVGFIHQFSSRWLLAPPSLQPMERCLSHYSSKSPEADSYWLTLDHMMISDPVFDFNQPGLDYMPTHEAYRWVHPKEPHGLNWGGLAPQKRGAIVGRRWKKQQGKQNFHYREALLLFPLADGNN